MKSTITTRARSPVGTFIALTLVVAVLIFIGLYLITDGGSITRLREMLTSITAAGGVLTNIQNNLKKYDRPQLITGYAILIIAGAAAVGLLGSFIRTNQYRFSGRGIVEKRGLWLYVPLCVVVWAALAGVLMLVDRWAVTGLVGRLLGEKLYERIGGYLVVPLWLGLSGGLAWLILWATWRRLARWLSWGLYVPGFRRRVPFSRVRRMEILNSGEGSTQLVLVLANGSAWTIQSGRVKRLQRLAAVLSRRLGLERRDFVTWA